jgi:hypothetical protein
MSTNTGKRAGAYSVPQNSFPLPTGSIFSFATIGFSFRKRLRRGNRYFILRNALSYRGPDCKEPYGTMPHVRREPDLGLPFTSTRQSIGS